MNCQDCTRSTSGHCWRHYANAAAGAYPTFTYQLNTTGTATALPNWNSQVWLYNGAGAAGCAAQPTIYTWIVP
jgi:hypothetical protein